VWPIKARREKRKRKEKKKKKKIKGKKERKGKEKKKVGGLRIHIWYGMKFGVVEPTG
jgi:hypothetical protein